MNKSTAKNPLGEDGSQYHIGCRQGDLAPYVLIPGDPGRIEKISQDWEKKKEIAFQREYKSLTGFFKKVKISCLSSGIGAPSLAIAVEEAARLKVKTFIRVGSTGALQKGINPGDLIINTGGVRLEGTSGKYVPKEYPALANYEVVLALIEACEKLKYKYHLGITASTDAFYVGEGRKGYQGYALSNFENILPDLKKARVLNLEMENAALFVLGNLYGLRTGAICAVFDNITTNKWKVKGEEKVGRVASEAVVILNKWDKIKERKNKKYFYPSLIN
jgi:uridine phosphorylase